MQRKNFIFIISLFYIIPLTLKSQSGWTELRTYGVNSFTGSNIHALADDFDRQIVYASIGSEVFSWKGGNSSWEKLGNDSTALHANSHIFSITTDPAHNVYAAGYFTNENNRCYVAKWNAGSYINNGWSEVGGLDGLRPTGPIYSIISDKSGNLYAAGSFLNSNTAARYVARFDGTSWSELGTGLNALNANNIINTLTTDSAGNIYAAGNFTNSSGKYYVAKWNGISWSEMGANTNALNANGRILSISSNSIGNITAVGDFTNGTNNHYVAKWNGNSGPN